MSVCAVSAKTICLLNENAQCNPIWVSVPDGLKLAHFPTLQRELTPRKNTPVDSCYEKCERGCLCHGTFPAD